MDTQKLIPLFQGSAVEADQLHEYLAQNNVASLIRNHMQETLSAAWMVADADHAAEVFVSGDEFIKAEGLLKNMFHDSLSSDIIIEEETDDPV